MNGEVEVCCDLLQAPSEQGQLPAPHINYIQELIRDAQEDIM